MPLTRDPSNPRCTLEAPALIAPPAACTTAVSLQMKASEGRTHLNKEGNDIRSDIYASDYPTVDNEVLIGT